MNERYKRLGVKSGLNSLSKYSIKDVERLCGIKAHTIRIWEQRYGLIKPERTDTNIRYYSNEELKKLLNVSLLLRHGTKISHICQLSQDEIGKRITEIENTDKTQEQFYNFNIDQLLLAMVDFNEIRVNKLIDSSIQKFGMESSMYNLLIPFLSKVGIMWRTGEVNVMQEHFTTNIIRQKIICSTERLPASMAELDESFLLFLPNNETHEIGLVFANYLIRRSGKRVLYAGQSLPVEDIIEFSNRYNPKYLLTFFSAGYNKNSQKTYIKALSENVKNGKIIVAKPIYDTEQNIEYKNIEYLNNFDALKAYL